MGDVLFDKTNPFYENGQKPFKKKSITGNGVQIG